MPQLIEEVAWEEEIGNSRVLREPVGVVGAITPWNYPLNQIARQGRPRARRRLHGRPEAERGGAAERLHPRRGDRVASACRPASSTWSPASGRWSARRSPRHPGVDMVSFTGSTRAGRRVSELAAATVKPVAMELGGKSPNVILDDADFAARRPRRRRQVLPQLGPDLQRADPDAGAARAARRGRGDRRGGRRGLHARRSVRGLEHRLGPLVSETQRERVRGYIEKGEAEGAKLLTGGTEPPEGLERGYFVRPTVFSEVTPEMTIAQRGDLRPGAGDPALRRRGRRGADRQRRPTTASPAASGRPTRSGRSRSRKRLRTGQIEINGGAFNPAAPFGGYGQSGHGRENGRFGLEELLQVKSLQL